MTSLVGGLVNFLESVDQRAGQYAARQHADGDDGLDDPLSAAVANGADDDDDGRVRTPSGEGPDGSGISQHETMMVTADGDMIATPVPTAAPPAASLRTVGSRDAMFAASASRGGGDPVAAGRADDAFVAQLRSDYDRAVEQLRDVTGSLNHARMELASIKGERDRLVDDVGNVVKQYNASLAQTMRLELEHQSLEAALTEAKQGRDALALEARQLEASKWQLEQSLNSTTQAFADFKAKTHLLLAERDAQLAAATRAQSGLAASGSSPQALETELGECRRTIAALEADIQRRKETEIEAAHLTSIVDRLKAEVSAAESRADAAARASKDAEHRTSIAQSMYDGELSAHATTRATLEAAIADREATIKTLQKAAALGAGGAGEGGAMRGTAGGQDAAQWERRAKDLAELVMEKQAALEAKRSEADQWRTRYEIAQQRVREVELLSLSAHGGGSSGGSSDGVRHRSGGSSSTVLMPHDEGGANIDGSFERSRFFGRLAVRGKIGAQITGVAKGIDDLTLRSANLLKRNSVMRVALVLYVAFLHLWVFTVLAFSSVPQAKPT